MHVDGKQFLIQLANDTSPVAVDLHFYIDGCAGLFSDDISLPFVEVLVYINYRWMNDLMRLSIWQKKLRMIVKSKYWLMIKNVSVHLSGFVFDPVAWAEESYEAAIEIYKVIVFNDDWW